jgi:hypothetical protein
MVIWLDLDSRFLCKMHNFLSPTGFAFTLSGWGRNNQITATGVMQHFRYAVSFAQAKCGPPGWLDQTAAINRPVGSH